MQSKATTVDEYLASLPAERREALQTVRAVFLKHLDKDYEEGMQYGMIGYYVPHRVFPAGYHCDPRQPLPFAGLASQKNHLSLYLMCVYTGTGAGSTQDKFRQAWAKTGKKLDMGKACIRFQRVEDLALDVIAATLKSMPAKKFIAFYESAIQSRPKATPKKKDSVKTKAAPKAKNPIKKSAKKK